MVDHNSVSVAKVKLAKGLVVEASDEVKSFVETVQRSDLLDIEVLRRVLASSRIKYGNQLPTDARTLAKDLVSAGVLTPWQAGVLLKGKHRGFYVGKYRLLRPLGHGATGAVYLAEHRIIQRQVAIKVLSKERGDDQKQVRRFEAEGRTAAQLEHPNVVQAYDFDTDGRYYFIVMEYIDGIDLHRKVAVQGPLPIADAVHYILQATQGMVYAHDNGVIHRDIKPANLLINRQGVVKISDMGLVLSLSEAVKASAAVNRLLGTADFVAPEQVFNSQTVDGRADIYSLGSTFFFLLTGRTPFGSGTAAQRVARGQTEEAPDVRKLRADCPREVAGVIWKMMRKKPSDRFRTSRDLLEVLQRLTAIVGPPTAAARDQPWGRGSGTGSASGSAPLIAPDTNSLHSGGSMTDSGGAPFGYSHELAGVEPSALSADDADLSEAVAGLTGGAPQSAATATATQTGRPPTQTQTPPPPPPPPLQRKRVVRRRRRGQNSPEALMNLVRIAAAVILALIGISAAVWKIAKDDRPAPIKPTVRENQAKDLLILREQ